MDQEFRPRAPFTAWTPQWVNPKAGFIWVAENPACIVSQCTIPNVTVEATNWLHDVLDRLLEDDFYRTHEGLVLLHDWRACKTIDARARAAFQHRSRARPGSSTDYIGVAYLALSTSSIVRMTIAAAGLAMQVTSGQPPIRVIDDPSIAIELHGIRAPSPDLWKRLRSVPHP